MVMLVMRQVQRVIALSNDLDTESRYRNLMPIGLTRKEKEKLVIDLYKQGLTYAQIAKEAHVSLRDIAPILNKTGQYQSLSNSSQAYKMFEEDSSPIQVAIALNLRENQVREYYREYWALNGLYQLNQVHEEIGNDIWSIIELHRRTKAEGLSPQQVSRILKTTTTLEHNNRNLECAQARLDVSNKRAAETFQQFTDLIQKDRKTREEYDYVISQQKRVIENLNIEKARLENNIDSIQHNDETCIKVKQVVNQVIENVISNPRRLLRLALASLFDSSRKHPGRLQALYYNMSSPLSVEQILSESSIGQNADRYRYDENEKLLIDEAELSYNRMVDAVTNNFIKGIPTNTESAFQILPLPIVQDDPPSIAGNHEILDTRDLPQFNLVYNNITFEIYPGLEISNERSGKTVKWPMETELDTSSFLQDQQE